MPPASMTESWSPIAQGAVLDDDVITEDRRRGRSVTPR
jgi:hypothetical protein